MFRKILHYCQLAILCMLASSCASVPEKLSLAIPSRMDEQRLCVPASASMILAYYGEEQTPRKLKQLAGQREDFEGTYFIDMCAGLEKLGYEATVEEFPLDHDGFTSGMQSIKKHLASGRPVIVSMSLNNVGHTMVAVGYDDQRQIAELMDPALDSTVTLRVFNYDLLEKVWHENFNYNKRGIMVIWPKKK